MKYFFISTLNFYLFKKYLTNFFMLIFALLALIYMFDTVELLRRASDMSNVSPSTIFMMSFFKLPDVGQQIFTFAVLFSAILTFWQLNKRHELVILRSAGLSVWQFIVPIIFAAFLIGVIKITMINPLSVLLVSRYETLESQYLDKNPNPINISEQGLWLRQDYREGAAIVHASDIKFPEWLLENITVFILDKDEGFVERLDAQKAKLNEGHWEFNDAVLNKPGNPPQVYEWINLETDITIAQLEKSFSSADTISFWKFPGYIKILDNTGFNSRPLKIYFQSLLSQPLLFMSMILLAATVSLRPPRNNGAFTLIMLGVGIGFLVFFASNFLQALGASAQIPLVIAAWFPAIITFILGIGVLMTLEDG